MERRVGIGKKGNEDSRTLQESQGSRMNGSSLSNLWSKWSVGKYSV